MANYRLRFWYWHQEVVISGITADELVHSIFFPENCEMKELYREVNLNGFNGPYPIGVSLYDPEHLSIEHLKKDDHESIDTHFGEDNGRTKLEGQYWILEEEPGNESNNKTDE